MTIMRTSDDITENNPLPPNPGNNLLSLASFPQCRPPSKRYFWISRYYWISRYFWIFLEHSQIFQITFWQRYFQKYPGLNCPTSIYLLNNQPKVENMQSFLVRVRNCQKSNQVSRYCRVSNNLIVSLDVQEPFQNISLFLNNSPPRVVNVLIF